MISADSKGAGEMEKSCPSEPDTDMPEIAPIITALLSTNESNGNESSAAVAPVDGNEGNAGNKGNAAIVRVVHCW